MNLSYNDYLLDLINDLTNFDLFNNELKLNIYLTLIALSKGYYNEAKYQSDLDIVDDFLRKTNNLKVKIQLKRKEDEITDLINRLKDIYEKNSKLIDKFNYDKLSITTIIENRNPLEITNLIDKLTKEKINYHDNKDMYDNLRTKIISHIFSNNYNIIDNNTLVLNTPDNNDIVISLDIFYKVFDYLLDIDNYQETLNSNHTTSINDIINILTTKTINKETLIPIILTNIINKNIPNPDILDFSKFNINNIRITDLYSIAGNNQNYLNEKSAKWNKIYIPNSYLHQRIKEIIKVGTYYFKDNIFYIEELNNFKISINTDNMLDFLKNYLSLLTNKITINK